MSMTVRDRLRKAGLTKRQLFWLTRRRAASAWFLRDYFTSRQRRTIMTAQGFDPVRYGTFMLAIEQLDKGGIAGEIAECGVWRGHLSKFLREQMPQRKLYLFDTFEGFDTRDSLTTGDLRFRDTSVEGVLDYIGDSRNVVVRKGFFPETAVGLEHERFALVVLDFDKYEPTLAGLEFFYEKMNSGGFIFVHDYSNPESDWACSRALNEFLADKPEKPMLIPDAWGSAFFRKF